MIKKNPLAMKFKEIFKRSHSFDHSWRYPDIEFIHIPYVPPILGQLLDLISPPKINISEPRFKSYDPWDMAN